MVSNFEYEYGIGCKYSEFPHRKGLSEDQAKLWMRLWLMVNGEPDEFFIIRRPISKWEKVCE